jgi:hypothetical protein
MVEAVTVERDRHIVNEISVPLSLLYWRNYSGV